MPRRSAGNSRTTGPTYSATTTGDVDVGLNGQPDEALSAALPVVHVDDLEGAFDAVVKAGGTIAKPIFTFPGGRRFHFLDPAGTELAVWSDREVAIAPTDARRHAVRRLSMGGVRDPDKSAFRPFGKACLSSLSQRGVQPRGSQRSETMMSAVGARASQGLPVHVGRCPRRKQPPVAAGLRMNARSCRACRR